MATPILQICHEEKSNDTPEFPGWSAAPLSSEREISEISDKDLRFRQLFPGKMKAFTDGHRIWLVRWVAQPTRQLHPVSDCLRASGYDVEPRPIISGNDGTLWGSCTASRGGESLRVKERIVDSQGIQFTDTSNWFWAATLGKSTGPWWSITEWTSAKD